MDCGTPPLESVIQAVINELPEGFPGPGSRDLCGFPQQPRLTMEIPRCLEPLMRCIVYHSLEGGSKTDPCHRAVDSTTEITLRIRIMRIPNIQHSVLLDVNIGDLDILKRLIGLIRLRVLNRMNRL